jgi:hypothetical protein
MRKPLPRLCGVLLLWGLSCPAVLAQSYPARNVEVIVPYGPGGLDRHRGTIICTEIPGAAWSAVHRAQPAGSCRHRGPAGSHAGSADGYTLLNSYTAEAVIVPHMLTTARYSVVDDFEPVAVTAVVRATPSSRSVLLFHRLESNRGGGQEYFRHVRTLLPECEMGCCRPDVSCAPTLRGPPFHGLRTRCL